MPHLGVACVMFGALGLYYAFFASPADYQQGEAVRIMYLHVPAATMAMGVYVGMAVFSLIFLVWRHSVADVLARASAPAGAVFTLIALITGSLWGKPMWGAWWVWDARLTSFLVLFFLYLGYMAIARQAQQDVPAQKICAVLAIIGCVNIPIIKFSVDWWNTLHQPASILRSGGIAIDPQMLVPLGLMMVAFVLAYLFLALYSARTMLWEARIRRARMKALMGLVR